MVRQCFLPVRAKYGWLIKEDKAHLAIKHLQDPRVLEWYIDSLYLRLRALPARPVASDEENRVLTDSTDRNVIFKLMSDQSAPEMVLQIWKFEKVPWRLRRHISGTHSGGWVAYISPGGAEDVIQELIKRWLSSGFSIERHEFRTGGIVLAGSPIRN